jgi:hypothetical protein
VSIIASVGFRTLPYRAEHGNAERGIVEVRRLDHVVLLVAAQAMLRTEGRRQSDVAARGQCIERMGQVMGERRGMGEHGHALSLKRRAQCRVREQSIDAELHRV